MNPRTRLPLSGSLADKLVRENRIIAIRDLQEESSIKGEHRKRLAERGYRSMMRAPLQIASRVIGIINLYSKEQREFKGGGARFLVSLPIAPVETTEAVGGYAQHEGKYVG